MIMNIRTEIIRFMLCLVAMATSSTICFAQITSPNACGHDVIAQYNNSPAFYFNNITDGLIAFDAKTETTIKWQKYNQATKAFDIEISSAQGSADTIGIDSDGLYQVEANGKTWQCWCIAPTIEIEQAQIDSVNCQYIYLTAKATAANIQLINPIGDSPIEIASEISYQWLANDSAQYKGKTQSVSLPSPTADTEYLLKAINTQGTWATDTLNQTAFAVEAAFKYAIRDREIEHEVSKAEAWSAPAEVDFTNLSKGNITAYEWIMGDAARLFEKTPIYTFQKSGEYEMSLIVTDENSLCSSTSDVQKIVVTESFLGFPKAFTPNGDGVNDEFRPSYKSLKTFHITIMGRWGNTVYESSSLETGWDGTTKGGGKAAEGTYYYVAEATGFDKGVSFKQKGSITLIR